MKGEMIVKRLLSFVLVALLAIPFAALGVCADTAAIPAEPQSIPVDVMPAWYIYYGSTAESGIKSNDGNSGTAPDQAMATFGNLMPNLQYTGGTIVIPGKGYIGMSFTLQKCEGTVTITANDKKNNVKYAGTLEVAPEGDGAYVNGTQIGMFMIYGGHTCSFDGDYIFDDIDIIERTETGSDPKKYSHKGTSIMSVNEGASLVIKDNVRILKMTDAPENVILNVDAGGYAYLHAIGFEKYTGGGVIVMDKALYTQTTDAQYAEFTGAVVDENGNLLRGTLPAVSVPADTTAAPADTTAAPAETTKAPDTTAAPADEGGNGALIGIIAAVAVVAVVGVVVVVVIKKKKAE